MNLAEENSLHDLGSISFSARGCFCEAQCLPNAVLAGKRRLVGIDHGLNDRWITPEDVTQCGRLAAYAGYDAFAKEKRCVASCIEDLLLQPAQILAVCVFWKTWDSLIRAVFDSQPPLTPDDVRGIRLWKSQAALRYEYFGLVC